ncbi:MAG: DUF4249 domain-containing protein [Salinivirgaceae bacterium]|nr:DUF4249 domain-containing protein [Salinivirgaceae bacterium]
MRYFKILIAVILLVGCEEYFRPDIDEMEPAYVIDGLLTDEPGPYKVKIMKTSGYNGKTETVTDAHVRIECSDGNTYYLLCDSSGCYLTDSAKFVGEVGKSYKLVAIFADGHHLESSYEEMLPSPEIEDINGFYYESKEIATNGDEYFNGVDYGICATNTTAAAGYTPYYRYDCKIVMQTHQRYPGTFPADRYIYRPFTPEGLLVIADANNYIDNKIIGNHIYRTPRKMLFIGIDSLVEGMTDFNIYDYGEFVLVKQFSMDENQYNYWKAVKEQQENTNGFFGHIENQPIGNINSNTGEKVLGYFCVSSVKQNFSALGLNESKKYVSKYDADYFPDTDTVAIYERPQDFTIMFQN